ncbi:MAG: histidine kinase dimerization/phosphoacceptor domain -containing protein [Vicingaceae bacterium]
MNRHLLLFSLLLLLIGKVYHISAQESKDQSSLSEYQRAMDLIDSCNLYLDKNQAAYDSFAQQFLEINFSQLADSNFRNVIYKRTNFLRRKFKYEEAIPILSKAKKIAKKNRDSLSLAFFHKRTSTHYYRLGKLDSTSHQLDQAYSLYKALNNKAEMGIIAIRKSRLAYDQGDYEKAVQYSFEAIDLHKDSGDDEKLAISYLQLGNTYLYLSNYTAAKKYFELAAILFKKTGNEYGYAESVSNSGLVEIKIGNYREGISKQLAPLNYFMEEGYARDVGILSNYIVEGYLGLQQFDSCLYYNELAKKQFRKSNYQQGICQSYLNEAKVFYFKNEYQKALESALKCNKIANENSYSILLKESHYELYQINKKLNRQEVSFYFLEQFVKLKDSLNFDPNILNSKAMKYQLAAEEAQLKLEIAEERAKLENERSEKTKQQLINTVVFAALLFLSLLITIFYLVKNRKLNKSLNLQRKKLSEDIKVKESLLSEIHHRVKNNLQVINSMLSLQNQFVTDDSVKKIIEECNGRIISMSLIHESLYRKKDFQEALFSNYIKELLPRLLATYGTDPSKIKLSMDIDPIKLSLDDSVPCGLLINEVISNSLKHGFPNGKEGSIQIKLKQIEHDIHLTIADDGVGLSAEKRKEANATFGALLIETMASQLGAEMAISTSNGFKYELNWQVSQ